MNKYKTCNNINEYLNKNQQIELNKELMSPFDTIKIIKDILGKNNIKKIIKIQLNNNINNITSDEQLVLNIFNDDRYIISILLSQNHTRNLLHDIYFIISNPDLFNSDIFKIMYDNRNIINDIPTIIKKIFKIITKSRLKKFYNRTMITRMISSLDYDYIESDNELYKEILLIFRYNVNKVKQELFTVLLEYESLNHNAGCYNLSLVEYSYLTEIHLGLKLNSKDFINIIKFAKTELDILVSNFNNIIDKIKPEYSNLKSNEKIKAMNNDLKLKCKTLDEYINLHNMYMDKSNDTFINKYKFPQYSKPRLLTFNDKNRGHAYWAFDTFYLNTYNWEKVNKYQILALVLHETIPGHHLHLNYSVHDKNNSSLNIFCHLFNIGINGFSEGLGLYAENLYEKFSEWERLGQIQYDIFRTIRLIIDIGIHIGGESANNMIEFMSNFVGFPKESIEVEIYRYIAMPGQALSYKIGCEIIKKIITNKNKNLISNEAINEFKNILLSKERPLQFLLDEYNIRLDDVLSTHSMN